MRSSILVATSRRRKELLLKSLLVLSALKTSFTFTLKQLTDVAKSK